MRITKSRLRPTVELVRQRPIEAVPAMEDGTLALDEEALRTGETDRKGVPAMDPVHPHGKANEPETEAATPEAASPAAGQPGRWSAERGRRRRHRRGGRVVAAPEQQGDTDDNATASVMDVFDGVR